MVEYERVVVHAAPSSQIAGGDLDVRDLADQAGV